MQERIHPAKMVTVILNQIGSGQIHPIHFYNEFKLDDIYVMNLTLISNQNNFL